MSQLIHGERERWIHQAHMGFSWAAGNEAVGAGKRLHLYEVESVESSYSAAGPSRQIFTAHIYSIFP